MRQQSKLGELSNNTELAYNMWSNSSSNKVNAVKMYTGLFPEGQFVEIGPVSIRPPVSKSVTKTKFFDSKSRWDKNNQSVNSLYSDRRNYNINKSQYMNDKPSTNNQNFSHTKSQDILNHSLEVENNMDNIQELDNKIDENSCDQ